MNNVYVALLRGINVGGKNKVDMKVLKRTFEKAGMRSVKTYINSGNVIFISNRAKIATTLEKAIEKDFGLRIKVIIRTLDDFKTLIKRLPKKWKNDQEMKSDVLFLWDEVDDSSIIDQLTIKPRIDTVKYIPGSILWMVERKDVTKSGMMTLASTSLYKKMTIRNVNTTRKIYDIMEGLAKHA